MKTRHTFHGAIAIGITLATLTIPSIAQSPPVYAASTVQATPLLSPSQLQDLVGRFALYPDDLVALILPASTTPLEIVKAQRFLTKYAADKSLKPDPSLSEPVMNLLTYPDVVNFMGDDLDWTEALGQAVTAQQQDILDAIQTFRRKAQSAGNLKTDDKQTIVVHQEIVQIVPTQPEVIYVPQYKPATVVVVQSAPVVTYAPTAYPVYYHPGAAVAVAATIGYIAGANNAYGCNWYGGGIYYAPRVAHYGHIQDERMDYANNAREDWQDYGKANREDWQNHANDAQSKRQQSASDNQSQRQQTVKDTTSANQGQRQDASRESQTQRQGASQQNQAQRQSTAQSRQSSASPEKGSQNWQPSAQTRPASSSGANRSPGASAQQRPASTPSKFGSGKASSSSAGAYGGASSGARAQTQSARGARSMSGTSRSGGGGGNRGGEGRARGR